MVSTPENQARKLSQEKIDALGPDTEQSEAAAVQPDNVIEAADRFGDKAKEETGAVTGRAEELKKGASAAQQAKLDQEKARAAAAEKNLLHQLDQVERELAAAQKKKKAASSVAAKVIGAAVQNESDIRAQEIRHADDIVPTYDDSEEQPKAQKRGFFGRMADRFAQGDVNRWNATIDATDAQENQQEVSEQFSELATGSIEKRVQALRKEKAEVEKKLRSTQGMLSMFKRGERWQLVTESDEKQQEYEAARAELIANSVQAALNEQLGDMDQRSATLNEAQNALMDTLNTTILGDNVTVRRAISMGMTAGTAAALMSGAGAAALGLYAGRRVMIGGLAGAAGYTGMAAYESRSLTNQLKTKREAKGFMANLDEYFRSADKEDLKDLNVDQLQEHLAYAQELSITRGIRPSADQLVQSLHAELRRRMSEQLESVDAEEVVETMQSFLRDAHMNADAAISQVKKDGQKKRLAAAIGASAVASGALMKMVEVVGDVMLPEAHAQTLSSVELDGMIEGNKQIEGTGVMDKVSDEAASRFADQGIELSRFGMKDTITGESYLFPKTSRVEIGYTEDGFLIQETTADGTKVTYRGSSAAELMENRSAALTPDEPVPNNEAQLQRFAQATLEGAQKGSVGEVTQEAAEQLAERGFVLRQDGSAFVDATTGEKTPLPQDASIDIRFARGTFYMTETGPAGEPLTYTGGTPEQLLANREAVFATADSSLDVSGEEVVSDEQARIDNATSRDAQPMSESMRKQAEAYIPEVKARVEKYGVPFGNGSSEGVKMELANGTLLLLQDDTLYMDSGDGDLVEVTTEVGNDLRIAVVGEGFVEDADGPSVGAEAAQEVAPTKVERAAFQKSRKAIFNMVSEHGKLSTDENGVEYHGMQLVTGEKVLAREDGGVLYMSADGSVTTGHLTMAAAREAGVDMDALLHNVERTTQEATETVAAQATEAAQEVSEPAEDAPEEVAEGDVEAPEANPEDVAALHAWVQKKGSVLSGKTHFIKFNDGSLLVSHEDGGLVYDAAEGGRVRVKTQEDMDQIPRLSAMLEAAQPGSVAQVQAERLSGVVDAAGGDFGSTGSRILKYPDGSQIFIHKSGNQTYTDPSGGVHRLVLAEDYNALPDSVWNPAADTRPKPTMPDLSAEKAAVQEGKRSLGVDVPPTVESPAEEAPVEAVAELASEHNVSGIDADLRREILALEEELPQTPDVANYIDLIQNAAQKYDLPPELIAGIMSTESQGNPRAISSQDARGLMQLKAAAAQDVGVTDRWDPAQNIDGGAEYFARQLNSRDGNVVHALISYNYGPGNYQKWMAKGGDLSELPTETREYISRVLGYYHRYDGDLSALGADANSNFDGPRAPRVSRPRTEGPIRLFSTETEDAYAEYKPLSGDIQSMAVELRAKKYDELVDMAFDSSVSEDQRTAAFMAIVHTEGSSVWYKDGAIFKNQNKPAGAEALRIFAFPDRVEFKFRGQVIKDMNGLPELRMNVEPPEVVEEPVLVDAEGKEVVPLAEQAFLNQREAIIDYVYAQGKPLGSLSEFKMPNGDTLLADDGDGKVYWVRSGNRRVEIRSAADLARVPGHEAILLAADTNRELILGNVDVAVPEVVTEGVRRAAEKANDITTNNPLGVDLDTLDERVSDLRNPFAEASLSREQSAIAEVASDWRSVEGSVESGEYAEWGTEYGRFVDDVEDALASELGLAQQHLDAFAGAQEQDLVKEQNIELEQYQERIARAKLLVNAAEHPDRIGAAEREILRDYDIVLPNEQTGSSVLADAVRDREEPNDAPVAKSTRKVGFFVQQGLKEVARADNVLAGVTENEKVVKGVLDAMAQNKLDRARALDAYAAELADGDRTKALMQMRAETLRDKADRLVDLREGHLDAQDARTEAAIEENSFAERNRGGFRYTQTYEEYRQFNETPELKEEALETVLAPGYERYVRRFVNTGVGPVTNTRETLQPTVELWDGERYTGDIDEGPGYIDRAETAVSDTARNLVRPNEVITPEDRLVLNLEKEAVRIYAAVNQIEVLEREMAEASNPTEIAKLQLQKEAVERFIRGRVAHVDRRYGSNVFLDSNTPGQLSERQRILGSMFGVSLEGPIGNDRAAYDDPGEIERDRNFYDN
jgi:hypothetical protein